VCGEVTVAAPRPLHGGDGKQRHAKGACTVHVHDIYSMLVTSHDVHCTVCTVHVCLILYITVTTVVPCIDMFIICVHMHMYASLYNVVRFYI
jgi:hypothetical protein